MNIKKYKKGFTLVELLIAMGLLTMLGLMLVKVLHGTMRVWSYAESQNNLHSKARRIINYLRQDLQSLFANNCKLIADYDKFARQRLRFVRKIRNEQQDPVLREAGNKSVLAGNNKYYHFISAKNKKLRAPGGLAEVVYLLDPVKGGHKLWRGLRAPLGGKGSFFSNYNISSKQIPQKCALLASNVLFFGIKCWGPNTISWKAGTNGPAYSWQTNLPIYPRKIQVVLILNENHCPEACLGEDISTTTTTIRLFNLKNFPLFPHIHGNVARINDEWISYQKCTDGTLHNVKRGLFATKIQNHSVDTPIYWGKSYHTTIYLPSYYQPWIKKKHSKKKK